MAPPVVVGLCLVHILLATPAHGQSWRGYRTFSLPDLTASNQVRTLTTAAFLSNSFVYNISSALTFELAGSYHPLPDLTLFGAAPTMWDITGERVMLGNLTAGARWGIGLEESHGLPVRLAVGASVSAGSSTSEESAPVGGLMQSGMEPDRYYHETTTLRLQADAMWWSKGNFMQIHVGFHRAFYPGEPDPEAALRKIDYNALRLAVAGGVRIRSVRMLTEVSRLFPIAMCSTLPDDLPCMSDYGEHLAGSRITQGVRYDGTVSVGLALFLLFSRDDYGSAGVGIVLDVSRRY